MGEGVSRGREGVRGRPPLWSTEAGGCLRRGELFRSMRGSGESLHCTVGTRGGSAGKPPRSWRREGVSREVPPSGPRGSVGGKNPHRVGRIREGR